MQDRNKFELAIGSLRQIISERGISKGELNYLVSSLTKLYVDRHGTSYAVLNDVVGVLGAANMEFYRRVVVPYEDKKIAENGDCY